MRFPVLISILLLPCGIAAAQQTERYTIDGDDVAVYNLAGTLQVESGQGAVGVQVRGAARTPQSSRWCRGRSREGRACA